MLREIQEACARHGIAPSLFGRHAANDPRLIADMEAGRRLRPETKERVREFIADLANGLQPTRREPVRPRVFVDRPAIDGSAGLAAHRRRMAKGSSRLLTAIRAVREAGHAA